MNIGFDLDGVLYPWHEAVTQYLEIYKKNLNVSYKDLWSDPYKYLSEEEWDYLASIPTVYETHVPQQKALDLLNKLDKEGHSIFYITHRWSSDVMRVTERYLSKYNFPQRNNLISTKDKGQAVRSHEIDLFVEDKPETLEELSGLCKVIGISHLWNEVKRPYLESLGVLFLPSVEALGEVI